MFYWISHKYKSAIYCKDKALAGNIDALKVLIFMHETENKL